jgi:hypothetical protein
MQVSTEPVICPIAGIYRLELRSKPEITKLISLAALWKASRQFYFLNRSEPNNTDHDRNEPQAGSLSARTLAMHDFCELQRSRAKGCDRDRFTNSNS